MRGREAYFTVKNSVVNRTQVSSLILCGWALPKASRVFEDWYWFLNANQSSVNFSQIIYVFLKFWKSGRRLWFLIIVPCYRATGDTNPLWFYPTDTWESNSREPPDTRHSRHWVDTIKSLFKTEMNKMFFACPVNLIFMGVILFGTLTFLKPRFQLSLDIKLVKVLKGRVSSFCYINVNFEVTFFAFIYGCNNFELHENLAITQGIETTQLLPDLERSP